MHLKNFSILHQQNEILLSPAYDLINGQLINPKDKEDVALKLNGKKKNIGRKDFKILANVLKIAAPIAKKIIDKYLNSEDKVYKLIDQSYLSDKYKIQYKSLWAQKLKNLSE